MFYRGTRIQKILIPKTDINNFLLVSRWETLSATFYYLCLKHIQNNTYLSASYYIAKYTLAKIILWLLNFLRKLAKADV